MDRHVMDERFRTQAQQLTHRQSRIYGFLYDNPVGVLSTVTPDQKPYGTAIYFGVDRYFELTFLTRSETQKYHNVIENNNVMLTVCDPKTQTVVQVTGTAHEVTDSYRINDVAEQILSASLHSSGASLPPTAKIDAGEHAAFVIKPSVIRMSVYGQPQAGSYSEIFESVESFDLEGSD